MGSALLALTALCPISRADEAATTGQGGWLGVTVQRLSDQYRERHDYRADGVLITAVSPGSLADQAGMARGDVLVVVGSVSVRHPDDVGRAESQLAAGNPVSVVVARDGGRMIRIMNLEPPPAPVPVPVEEPRVEPAVAGAPSAPVAGAGPSRLEVLGMKGEKLGPELAEALGLGADRGFVVLQVPEGTSARVAGVRPGDVVTRVGDKAIESPEDLERALEAGSTPVSLVVQRQGSERRIEVAPWAARKDGALGGEAARVEDTGDAQRDAMMLELRAELRMLRQEVERLRQELDRLRAQ
jgi:serine protease Do